MLRRAQHERGDAYSISIPLTLISSKGERNAVFNGLLPVRIGFPRAQHGADQLGSRGDVHLR